MSAGVVAYTDPNCPHCPHCPRLKEYLGSQTIPFENRGVTADPRASDELRSMNAPGVPVVKVGDAVVWDPTGRGSTKCSRPTAFRSDSARFR